ncbi:hypothetical protein PLESTB_000839300 [Pleodorina starrii]|uniref:Uncharacterized protein n=1 Tax=Pleodorina starrii TaxID=330485 RepID=A0A9W6BMU0_9CHLO|nr:hypothetical protein PLESTM_000155100 [Pleodorina starrii]GLC54246.1 hypothetical protein PLESTB_000839300 [Pleodorina starrii]GLC64452.1 hypothetical protein PLESTF_000167500 [Pleodorina starrii]
MFNLCRKRKNVDAIPPSPRAPSEKTAPPAEEAATVPVVASGGVDQSISLDEAGKLYDLRSGNGLPAGSCMYIQSGDTSDFDGYLIAAAGHVLQRQTPKFEYVIAVPERRAWRDKNEPDTSKHDPTYSTEVLATAGALLRHLCPDAILCRGLLNQRNLIPWNMMFNEPEKYAPLIQEMPEVAVGWTSLEVLAQRILSPELSSVVLDMNGSMGYLAGLIELLGPEGEKVLGRKMKASGLPLVMMAGIQAEVVAQTLKLPGRDPRATKNAIYYPDAVRVLLRLAKEHGVPLLFVTNNTCNRLIKFQDAPEVISRMGLRGMLERIATVWFSLPYLVGKCVPFDWVAFVAMLLYGRRSSAVKIERQELYVGKEDPSVLVLRDPSQPSSDVVTDNLAGTECWGEVESVADISLEVMLQLSRHAAAHTAC